MYNPVTSYYFNIFFLYIFFINIAHLLVFNQNILLILKLVASKEAIRLGGNGINRNNNRESTLQVDHNYQVGDKVLVSGSDIHRNLNCPTRRPRDIRQVHPNGIVRVQKGTVGKRLNIKYCTPYTELYQ